MQGSALPTRQKCRWRGCDKLPSSVLGASELNVFRALLKQHRRCLRAPLWLSSESLKFSVARIYLLAAGLMLCSIPACSLGNKELFIHLRHMKNIPSHSCLGDRIDFKFPWKRENIAQIQMTQGPWYHYLMLQQIFNLFTTEDSRDAWNNTLLHKFLSSLDQRLDRLQQMGEDHLDCPDLGLAARKYFHGIHLYLEDKEYSPCAWEVVRVEVERCFSLM
ncbi:interferon alpha-8-like [Hippopotamus amphibius kiboko]|uniref:interferon alpha-8-like n=1 Tax=Hippopotamus amphibius kiboko TaxID=575201 RepID=UPI002597C101|nr:interferon alpha-8-like [Hippopotamus amphibius kiboko]